MFWLSSSLLQRVNDLPFEQLANGRSYAQPQRHPEKQLAPLPRETTWDTEHTYSSAMVLRLMKAVRECRRWWWLLAVVGVVVFAVFAVSVYLVRLVWDRTAGSGLSPHLGALTSNFEPSITRHTNSLLMDSTHNQAISNPNLVRMTSVEPHIYCAFYCPPFFLHKT